MTDAPTDKKLSERFARAAFAPGLVERGRAVGKIRDEVLSFLRLAESHPSAIREAVEGEREACAKLVAAHGIAGMPFDVGSWTPGAVAAAIRARGEEKGK